MFRIFRKVRQSIFAEGNFRKYTLYAIGEIILVVIGILIALQINNMNENKKTRKQELVYLSNIRADLELNITSLREFVETRQNTVNSVDLLMEYYEEKKEVDPDNFNLHNVGVLIWYPFIQHANTFQELMNSGNFGIISNKSIKNELQDMQTSFGKIAFIENEMQQDYDRYLYEVFFNVVDFKATMMNYDDQLSNRTDNSQYKVDMSDIESLLNSKLYENGLVLSSYNSGLLVEEYTNMIERTTELIDHIDEESKR